MMKLFVSYRRKDWPFAQMLKRGLRRKLNAEIFRDIEDVDEPDFERSILRNLRTSDVVLVIVTEYTFSERIHFEDDWVRREIREALRLRKPTIVVFVDGQSIPGDIPSDIAGIRRMQGVNFYADYFDAALFKLVHFIDKATPIKAKNLQAEKVRLEKTLKPIQFDLAEIQSGKRQNVNHLLEEFSSYLTLYDEVFPEEKSAPQPQTSGYSLALLEELVRAAAQDDTIAAQPYTETPIPENPPKTDPLEWLNDIARESFGGLSPDDLLDALNPRPPADRG